MYYQFIVYQDKNFVLGIQFKLIPILVNSYMNIKVLVPTAFKEFQVFNFWLTVGFEYLLGKVIG